MYGYTVITFLPETSTGVQFEAGDPPRVGYTDDRNIPLL